LISCAHAIGYSLEKLNKREGEIILDKRESNYGCDVMKGTIVISLILLAGLASAYTPEQQTALDGMNLSFRLGMAYANAIQGQNVTEYNTLVDNYNTWIRQNFGEDASLLRSKMNVTGMPILIASPTSGAAYLVAPFNTSSDLSTFGSQRHLVAGGAGQSQQYDISQAEQRRFLQTE
jgi:hypothetical protein